MSKRDKPPHDIDSQIARERLMAAIIKQPYMSQMQRGLVTEVDLNSKPVDEWSIGWYYYAGMGDTAVNAVDQGTLKTARELIKTGYIVPTTVQTIGAFNNQIRHLTHFNDVAWGKKEDGTTVIMNLSPATDHWPHTFIELEKMHEAALEELTSTFEHYKEMKYTPNVGIPVNIDGENIYPIITERKHTTLLRAQKEQNPEAFKGIPTFD